MAMRFARDGGRAVQMRIFAVPEGATISKL